ncbi:MAG TPA: gamma-glutamyltransferase, partial [Segetibacter sp.]|nr:gamma-glutamyltransferase [Segetibacter sp.]
EAERRAYADRAEHLGDPDFWKVPVKTITSEAYLAKRMADYDSTKASKSTQIKAGSITESLETTHISIADKWGNVVAVTTTLNGNFGSKTVVGGGGFFLNNEMDDFSIKPGVPNMYGAVGGEANAIAPGKRMLSSMAPTIVLKGKKPFMVVGTPGGTTIPTSVYQTIVDVVDFKMSAEEAVNKPKFHHQWLPDEIQVEEGFPKDVMEKLEQMGYTVKVYYVAGYASTIGRVELIKINNGKLEAAADKRGDDTAAGY